MRALNIRMGSLGERSGNVEEFRILNKEMTYSTLLGRLTWQQPKGLFEEIRDQRQKDQFRACCNNTGVMR